jgi:hypothetical protein
MRLSVRFRACGQKPLPAGGSFNGAPKVSMASCPAVPYRPSCWVMFSVDETTAAAIRKAFEESGELSAVVELRRHFPGLKDNENARVCVRAIAGWKPLPPLPNPTESQTNGLV